MNLIEKAVPNWKLFAECYQIAGGLLQIDPIGHAANCCSQECVYKGNSPDHFTSGQRDRLTELLMNVLSNPQRYSARLVRNLAKMAVEK